MQALYNTPLFGLSISLFTYLVGIKIKKKLNSQLFSPIIFAHATIIITLVIFNIDVEYYNKGGNIIALFLTPSASVLALSIYRNLKTVKENFFAVFKFL